MTEIQMIQTKDLLSRMDFLVLVIEAFGNQWRRIATRCIRNYYLLKLIEKTGSF